MLGVLCFLLATWGTGAAVACVAFVRSSLSCYGHGLERSETKPTKVGVPRYRSSVSWGVSRVDSVMYVLVVALQGARGQPQSCRGCLPDRCRRGTPQHGAGGSACGDEGTVARDG